MSSFVGPARMAFALVAALFALCSVVQVYLAGLGVFSTPTAFLTHRDFGYLFGLLTLVLIVLALVGRLPRVFLAASILLLVLFALQSVFVLFRDGMPALAALHPLNGFVIVGVAVGLAWASRRLVRAPADAASLTAADR